MPRRRKTPDPRQDPPLETSGEAEDSVQERPSKSARKREMLDLQRLGASLIELKPDQLARVPLDERLRDAVLLAQRIHSNEAIRRQRQLIGRLMREADADAIRAAFDAEGAQQRADSALAKAAEQWREQLLNDADATAAFVRRFNAQAIEADLPGLIVGARAERDGAENAGRYRALFRTVLKAMREARTTAS